MPNVAFNWSYSVLSAQLSAHTAFGLLSSTDAFRQQIEHPRIRSAIAVGFRLGCFSSVFSSIYHTASVFSVFSGIILMIWFGSPSVVTKAQPFQATGSRFVIH